MMNARLFGREDITGCDGRIHCLVCFLSLGFEFFFGFLAFDSSYGCAHATLRCWVMLNDADDANDADGVDCVDEGHQQHPS